jgi:hypothetical protein
MTTDRHGRAANSTDDRDHVWIVSKFKTDCAECGDELPPGSHILWLPGQPRDKNNYCAPCGTEMVGSYPPANYWERRDHDFMSQ